MRRSVLSALIVVLFIVGSATSANARSSHTAVVKAKQTYYHTDGYIKAIGKNARRTIYHPNPRISHRWKRDLHYLVQVRHRAYLVLHPAPRVSYTTSHFAMWLCIHAKEGAWNSATGNGYYGGLQMTSGWGGVSRPDLLSAGAQIALAESQYRASGYSIAWIRQQWPNTSYGCI